MPLREATLDALTIDDDATLAKIAVYRALKRHLKTASYRFRIADRQTAMSWDRALFLNLTFWTPKDGADVLVDEHLAADVLAHVAWHHLANARLEAVAADRPPSAMALFFGESIASAFDLYLVGRLVETAPDSDFIESQVPIMADAAQQAGLSEDEFEALVASIHAEPERAFEEMRALLLEVAVALHACEGVSDALAALERFGSHRFAPLLHHYQLSNWILYARAHARPDAAQDAEVARLDETLRAAGSSLAWLETNWLGQRD